MVKFLSGGQYEGSRVPTCIFWSLLSTTDKETDLAVIEGQANAGNCIANAFFPVDDISCFNEGNCNDEGKCLPCTKYRFGGARLAISHSPPLELLKTVNKGLTDEELQSPDVTIPANIAGIVENDQLPYHILLRNVQARIQKCCRWSLGDGLPDEFFVAPIIDGPDTFEVRDSNGNLAFIRGILVKDEDIFPDEVGTFFPIGNSVVAGWKAQPSFYLEPRTGLQRDGEGVIYAFNTPDTSVATSKAVANSSQVLIPDAGNHSISLDNAAAVELSRIASFAINAGKTNSPELIEAAGAKLATALLNKDITAAAVVQIDTLTTTLVTLNSTIQFAQDRESVEAASQEYAANLNSMAIVLEDATDAAAGSAEEDQARNTVRLLRIATQQMVYSGSGGLSKCEFFVQEDNSAKKWNFPEDGTLPCNGVRTECVFYTGPEWEFATDAKMEIGQNINAEQIQEIRFFSDDWSAFDNPENEWEGRFSVPFIWAFKGYVDIGKTPDIEDFLLYRQKLLFPSAEGTVIPGPAEDLSDESYQTIEMDKVSVGDYTDFSIEKSSGRILPGSITVSTFSPPQFPTLVDESVTPSVQSISITHPPTDETFIYRSWNADANKISLFGEASASSTIYIVNDTALRDRTSYLDFYGDSNYDANLPTGLPGAPTFAFIPASRLKDVFDQLEVERRVNDSRAPLGFDIVRTSVDGTWESIQQVDLIHNVSNNIYVFLLLNDEVMLFDKTVVDYRFLHSVIKQNSFLGTDFTIHDTLGLSKLGATVGDITQKALITAQPTQVAGSETLNFNQGYYGWRVKNRGLRTNAALTTTADLTAGNIILDTAVPFVTESDASTFIVNTAYHVVQYRKSISLESEDWYPIDECGSLMCIIRDTNAHRVLPLPDTSGAVQPLTNVLVNGGGFGSTVAQWAIESATFIPGGTDNTTNDSPITRDEVEAAALDAGMSAGEASALASGFPTAEEAGSSGETAGLSLEPKELIQFYRDANGFGLPANHVILGPGQATQDKFGRADPEKDKITITFTFLRAETNTPAIEDEDNPENSTSANEAELSEEVITTNFYDDPLRNFEHTIEFDSQGLLTAGGERIFADVSSGAVDVSVTVPITQEQQEYVWVLEDSDGRPIGRKYSRMLLMYSSVAAVNVEIFYAWSATCTLYALLPDLYLTVGNDGGELQVEPKATTDGSELSTGGFDTDALGDHECVHKPNCATHEFFPLGPLRREFEVILLSQIETQTSPTGATQESTVVFDNGGKAFYPSAGQALPNFAPGQLISEPPGSQWLLKRGPMWYPYVGCERPRYKQNTYGPLNTDVTELINQETEAPGLTSAGAANSAAQSDAGSGNTSGSPALLTSEQAEAAAGGQYGSLPPKSDEAYRGPDRMVAKILATHPSIRICSSAFTYGNQVLKSASAFNFKGYGRKRGEIDIFWFAGLQWPEPPFGNFGRPKLTFEVTTKRGDYLGGFNGRSPGFRWMPMFPEREDIGATVELWSEDLEPQQYRLINSSTPLGGIGETQDGTRHRHKELITNIPGAAIEYPFSPYFPSFLPDALLGTNGGNSGLGANHGQAISTMGAWREQEQPILRGQAGSSPVAGLKYTSPDYFLDNRRLEVRIRPAEGNYLVTFIPPTYNEEGVQTKFGTLQLGEGPPREISIDYSAKEFSIIQNGIYDTSAQIGEEGLISGNEIPCADGTPTDNGQLASTCECILDIDDPSLRASGGDPAKLPSRFVHLDEFAVTANQFALYASNTIETPVAVDIQRDLPEDPCCQCLYYIRGILAEINLEDLPITTKMDPVFDSRVDMKYTWSRVPHGYPAIGTNPNVFGEDGAFGSKEHLADSYISATAGRVFRQRFGVGITTTDPEGQDGEMSAFFPSNSLAQDLRLPIGPSSLRIIPVDTFAPGDPALKGGIPATPIPSGTGVASSTLFSNGQVELVNIDMVFSTPVKITSIKVTFMAGETDTAFAGQGGPVTIKWQTPTMVLGVIDSDNRVTPPFITRRTPRVLATTTTTAFGKDIPGSFTRNDRTAIDNGAFLFQVPINPNYVGVPYWNQFGQEFHLIFNSRNENGSMGIAGIEMEVEAMVPSDVQLQETIKIRERKYNISTGAPAGGNNPESFLTGMDSASGYWRTTTEGSIQGANKFRSYAWGPKLEDNQQPLTFGIKALEELQEREYNKARDLQEGAPYEFSFSSFYPPDEKKFLNFVTGGSTPTWTTTLSHTVSPVNEVRDSSGALHFGEIPERTNWSAPGHAWSHDFVTAFGFCCDPPSRCPAVMTMDYNFSHLHDGLTTVITSRFWDELPSGITRLIRSTLYQPDAGFLSGAAAGSLSGEGIAIINDQILIDSKGRQIDSRILDQAGVRKTEDGTLIIIEKGS